MAPRVVCLFGSLRFAALFRAERRRLTAQGAIVLGPEETDRELTPDHRAMLGKLHLRRIDLADEVRIISVDGYLGEATRRELDYARSRGKTVSALETDLLC
jgi:hypothetical protein